MPQEEEDDGEFLCVIPTLDMLNSDESLKILDTHEWALSSSSATGYDAILLKIRCKNCGLQRISIVSDIQDSAERARDYRDKRKNNKEIIVR